MSKIAASAEMLIRKPPNDVFDAFTDPRTLEKFWLKSASGPLAEDAVVEWEFLVQGARETVKVTKFVAGEAITFVWSDGIAVTIKLHPQDAIGTRVSVTAIGFKGTDASSQALNATEGFTIVLCDLKSLLETGQSGNMVRDKAALITADKADA
ncbi:SRPBCC domain-containing protein [Lysobacter koreensis]|uniref:SRPBCC domain-containing protein n=1 Tax=Lysobacter koreensis TaxID=266122 RepID=A0ABW2YNM0_9GAMM